MKTFLCLSAVALAALLAGCETDDEMRVSTDDILDDLTPELQTLTERPVDVDRNLAVNNNQNDRMFWDDLGRVFYTNQPSTLSPYPIVSTSGVPR